MDPYAETLFQLNPSTNKPMAIDAQDHEGNTPLNLAMQNGNMALIEFLLRKGADPHVANFQGTTPLQEFNARLYPRIARVVSIPAAIRQAAANLWPYVLDLLLERADPREADLANFVFPNSDHFYAAYSQKTKEFSFSMILRLTAASLAVVERLERHGYELQRSDALEVMNWIGNSGFLLRSVFRGLDNWRDEEADVDDEFTRQAKTVMMVKEAARKFSLYDLLRMSAVEARRHLTLEDYMRCEPANELWKLDHDTASRLACYLCEKLAQGFFRRWAERIFFNDLNLPPECSEMLMDELTNEDLWRACKSVMLDEQDES